MNKIEIKKIYYLNQNDLFLHSKIRLLNQVIFFPYYIFILKPEVKKISTPKSFNKHKNLFTSSKVQHLDNSLLQTDNVIDKNEFPIRTMK